MTRPLHELMAECADALEASRPDLADELRKRAKQGRKPCEGVSPHVKRLADLWEAHTNRVDAGEDEGDVAADLMGDMPETTYWNLIALDGRNDVRAELKRRRRFPR